MRTHDAHLPLLPAAFFGVPLGVLALGIAWRGAAQIWAVPKPIGEGLIWLGAALWACLFAAYLTKWVWQRAAATAEFEHPVQCCFVGLAGVVASLASIGVIPYLPRIGFALFALGAAWTIAFAAYRTGRLWMGGRDVDATTPILYLPTVAGGFVTASAAASSGHVDWGQLAFGAGLFAWLAIESVLLHRLYTAAPLSPALRPTLGIQLAPPAVAAVAYLNVGTGLPDIFAHALIGYALLQALILIRLWPWIRVAGATPAWWGFSFGAAALPTAAIKLVARGDMGAVALLAPWLFVLGNVVIVAIAIMTVRLAVNGNLLPMQQPVVAPGKEERPSE
jgi:tellurite resistance protein